VLRQLNAAYDSYVQAARQVQASRQPVADNPVALPEITEFEGKANRLLALGQQLAEAHGEAREGFLSQANAQLGHLRFLLFSSAALSLALMVGLGWFVYRDLIAPLRTRLVQSEAVLERQEKLATLGTLAAGIAHEIRNPLTSIKARLYMLARHIKGNEAGLSDTTMIGDEIARLERIVQDVLQFARPSEPRFKVVRADTPLREVHSLMATALEQNHVRLTLDSQTEQLVSMDVSLIKQVVVNLVRNAAEAIEQEGTVTLRAHASQAKLNGRVREVAVLEVADTGKGIPPEVEKRLFDPFFSTKEAGTGLGLSIAARIVDKHGGALQYQTQVGRGTTFGIVLPVAQRDADKAESGPI
jgi:signal transduction histidine kinase